MATFYLICAVVGCTLLAVQFILTLLGMGHDHDFDFHGDVGDVHLEAGAGEAHFDADGVSGDFEAGHGADHGGEQESSWFLGVLSFRALTAAAAFFGLSGTAGLQANLNPYLSLCIALAAGGCAMVLIAWIMRTLHRLNDEGTVRIGNALGAEGTVYLSIPAEKSGTGKVTISIQHRTMEYRALTAGAALATGEPIVVTGVVGGGVLEVAAASSGKEG